MVACPFFGKSTCPMEDQRGNGGKGGDLILKADENVADLRNYHFKKHWKAKNGEPGRGSDQNGKGGDRCILKVPMGTEIREIESGDLICELMEHEQEVLLLEGGKGGEEMQLLKVQ